MINYKWEIIDDAASNFHDQNVVTLLEKHEREHGNEVVVTKVDSNLKYFDIKVTNFHNINKEDILNF